MLTNALRANAIFSTACGATLILTSSSLANVFEVPQMVILAVGSALLPFAAVVWRGSTSPHPALVRLIISADTVWVVSAIILIVGFPQAMSTIGLWALGFVTLVVADLAIAQGVGLRRKLADAGG